MAYYIPSFLYQVKARRYIYRRWSICDWCLKKWHKRHIYRPGVNDTRTCDGWMSIIEKGVTTDVVDTGPQGGKRIHEAYGGHTRTGPPAYLAWWAGIRQPYARVDFIPPSQGLWIWQLKSKILWSQRDYTVRGQTNAWRLPKYWPPPPHRPASVSPPPRLWCGGRTYSLGGEEVGCQYFGRCQTLLCLYSTYVSTLWLLCCPYCQPKIHLDG
jgi:hypothetical protein